MLKALTSCCCPAEDEREDGDGGDEQSRLIRNGGAYTGRRDGAYGSTSGGGQSSGRYQSDKRNGTSGADDEQAILARILHDTANNVIDVSATDVQTVEAGEYMARARKYNQQLSSQITAATLQQAAGGGGALSGSSSGGKRASTTGTTSARCLLTDSSNNALTSPTSAPSTDKILSAPPLHSDEISMIRQLSSQMFNTVGDIRVEHKEDLVVQFGPS